MSKHADRIGAFRRIGIEMCRDLSLLSSFYLARFIVWQTLRAGQKERAAKLKSLKPVKGSG